jgi:DNA-directed RNA polymerase specialized sigma24 family protein
MLTRIWPGAMTDVRDMKVRIVGKDESDDAPRSTEYRSADEQTLVEASLAGHRDAFDAIVERHRRNVYRLCYRFVGNHEDASDLAQDVFVRAYRGLTGFKREASLATCLKKLLQ